MAVARNHADFVKKSSIYQMFLRPFTCQGTLDAAARMLPNIAALGFDIVYLCPIFKQDDDPDPNHWSPRQQRHKENFQNPCNPYRINDYFTIDPEYGDDEALLRFVNKAHSLGLKVILDLVYYHCGLHPAFLEEHPDFVQHEEDGSIKYGHWTFPQINYESQELREYLWSNMEYFIKKFDVDGYRCDVAGMVPVDFWEEGRRRIEALKPDVFMLSEAETADALEYAFDANYEFGWCNRVFEVINGEKTVQDLIARWMEMHDKLPEGGLALRALDTHDRVMAFDDVRIETKLGTKGVEAALVINYTMDGMPFVYNGYEVCDTAQHCIDSNRFYNRNFIDWSGALTEKGRERMRLLCILNDLKHTEVALQEGEVTWLANTCADKLVAYTRTVGSERIMVLVNTADVPVTAKVQNADFCEETSSELLEYGTRWVKTTSGMKIDLLPRGYLVIKY